MEQLELAGSVGRSVGFLVGFFWVSFGHTKFWAFPFFKVLIGFQKSKSKKSFLTAGSFWRLGIFLQRELF